MKKRYFIQTNDKIAGILILILDKIEFATNAITKIKSTLYNDKRINTRKVITLIHIYAPNRGALKYIQQTPP